VDFASEVASVVVDEEGFGDMDVAEGMWYFVVMRVCEGRAC
jgi:hypothetical protein